MEIPSETAALSHTLGDSVHSTPLLVHFQGKSQTRKMVGVYLWEEVTRERWSRTEFRPSAAQGGLGEGGRGPGWERYG